MVVIGYILRPRVPASMSLDERIERVVDIKVSYEMAREMCIKAGPSKAAALKNIEECLRKIDIEIETLDREIETTNKKSLELELEKKARNGDLIAFMEWKALKGIDK